jgi:hypothetical protein
MIPLMKPVAASLSAPQPQRKAQFRIFPGEHGRWCALSEDGLTGGTFFTHEAALCFARRESTGVPALVLHVAAAPARGHA